LTIKTLRAIEGILKSDSVHRRDFTLIHLVTLLISTLAGCEE